MLKKYMLFIFPKSSPSPNKHIFVKVKRGDYCGKSAYYEWAQYRYIIPFFTDIIKKVPEFHVLIEN